MKKLLNKFLIVGATLGLLLSASPAYAVDTPGIPTVAPPTLPKFGVPLFPGYDPTLSMAPNYPRFSSFFTKHSPYDGKTQGEFYESELDKVIANPDNYYFGLAHITGYAPLDAQDIGVINKAYDSIYESGDTNAKLTYPEFVEVGDSGYIARNANTSTGTAVIVTFEKQSPFQIAHSMSTTQDDVGNQYRMMSITFSTGSKSRIDRLLTSLQASKDSKAFQYFSESFKSNSEDTSVSFTPTTGDGLSFQTRYQFTASMHASAVNKQILLTLENRELTLNSYGCKGAGMQYSLKNDGDVLNSAWRMQNGASRLGAIARPKDTFLQARNPLIIPGIWVGSIGDTGGAINTNQVSPAAALNDPNDKRAAVIMPHFDILVDSCLIAFQDIGSRGQIPYITLKSATNPDKAQAFEAAQVIAKQKYFQPFFDAQTPDEKKKMLKFIIQNQTYFGTTAKNDNAADTSGGGSADGDISNTQFTPSGGKSARSLVFENQELADNQVAYTIFKGVYGLARFFVNAAGLMVVVVLFYVPLLWLCYLLSRQLNYDFVRMVIPFKKQLSHESFTAFAPGFAKRLTVITILVLMFSSLVISGLLNDVIALILHYIIDVYTNFSVGSVPTK